METVVGIFASRTAAENAVHSLLADVVPDHAITFLTGGESANAATSLPTTDAESDGMGKALGAVVGGAAGAGAGFALGSMAVSLAVPGIGPILAAGLGAAALLGLGGAAAGAEVGKASETAMDEGVPRDDVYFFRDLLSRGKSLVIANCDSETQAGEVREIFAENNAEDFEQLRKQWHPAA
jgi:hypothetical protein